jgi:hypothetical protein
MGVARRPTVINSSSRSRSPVGYAQNACKDHTKLRFSSTLLNRCDLAGEARDAEQLLKDAFQRGLPVVAFLGQSVGVATEAHDPVLRAALKKLGRSGTGWKALLGAEELETSFFEWMSEGFYRTPVGAELAAVGDAPFSAIYTSSLDPRLRNLFETNGREPEPVLFGDPPPPIKRSRRRPPFYALFGYAGSSVAEFSPPSSSQRLAKRRMLHASPMARTMLETATALGLVVVDGFEPMGDWFRSEDLLALLADAPPGGVLWFGPPPSFNDEDGTTFASLVHAGVIIPEARRLGRLLAQIAASDAQLFEQRWDDPGVISFAKGNKLVTSPSIRLATEASATIVDDGFTAFLPPLSDVDRTGEFRTVDFRRELTRDFQREVTRL